MVIEPKVWIGCLASYNAGRLIGEWFKLSDFDSEEEFAEAVQERVLSKTGGEEFHVCDYEEFEPFSIDRYQSLSEIWKKARLLLDSDDVDMVRAGIECYGESYVLAEDDPEGWLRERFAGRYEREGDYAWEFTESTVDIPESLSHYIDWARMERDWVTAGDILCVEYGGERFFFRND